MLTGDQAAFVQSEVVILLASADESLVCDVVRVFGATVDPDLTIVTLYVPEAANGRTLANARKHPRLAAVFGSLLDYRTLQIKGTCVGVRPETSADRAVVQRYRDALLATVEKVGRPRLASRWGVSLPCTALELRTEEIYGLTPVRGRE